MKSILADYQISHTLKEIGFDKPCLAHYGGMVGNKYKTKELQFNAIAGRLINWNAMHTVSVPTYDQIREWFIEKHNCSIEVLYKNSNKKFIATIYPIFPRITVEFIKGEYEDYRTALIKAIEKTIKVINERKI